MIFRLIFLLCFCAMVCRAEDDDMASLFGQILKNNASAEMKACYRTIDAEKPDDSLAKKPKDVLNQALLYAASQGKASWVTQLLKAGADANAKPKVLVENPPALLLACYAQSAKTVEILLTHGAKVDATDASKNTSMHIAALIGNAPIIKLLATHKADPNAKNAQSYTPLFSALSLVPDLKSPKQALQACKALVAAGASTDTLSRQGETLLSFAAASGDDGLTAYVIDLCPKAIDQADKQGFTPLMQASSPNAAKVLLDKGATIDAVTSNGETALHMAILRNNAKVAELLLNSGADLSIRTKMNQRFFPVIAGSTPYQALTQIVDDLRKNRDDGGLDEYDEKKLIQLLALETFFATKLPSEQLKIRQPPFPKPQKMKDLAELTTFAKSQKIGYKDLSKKHATYLVDVLSLNAQLMLEALPLSTPNSIQFLIRRLAEQDIILKDKVLAQRVAALFCRYFIMDTVEHFPEWKHLMKAFSDMKAEVRIKAFDAYAKGNDFEKACLACMLFLPRNAGSVRYGVNKSQLTVDGEKPAETWVNYVVDSGKYGLWSTPKPAVTFWSTSSSPVLYITVCPKRVFQRLIGGRSGAGRRRVVGRCGTRQENPMTRLRLLLEGDPCLTGKKKFTASKPGCLTISGSTLPKSSPSFKKHGLNGKIQVYNQQKGLLLNVPVIPKHKVVNGLKVVAEFSDVRTNPEGNRFAPVFRVGLKNEGKDTMNVCPVLTGGGYTVWCMVFDDHGNFITQTKATSREEYMDMDPPVGLDPGKQTKPQQYQPEIILPQGKYKAILGYGTIIRSNAIGKGVKLWTGTAASDWVEFELGKPKSAESDSQKGTDAE